MKFHFVCKRTRFYTNDERNRNAFLGVTCPLWIYLQIMSLSVTYKSTQQNQSNKFQLEPPSEQVILKIINMNQNLFLREIDLPRSNFEQHSNHRFLTCMDNVSNLKNQSLVHVLEFNDYLSFLHLIKCIFNYFEHVM